VTRKELNVFKKQLLNEKTLLLQGISPQMKGSPRSGDPEGGDVCDIASSDRERELRLRLSERGREKLREIEDALERIAEGSFGTCDRCGCKIPKGRLKVMPFSTTCVACKSRQEKQRKLYEGASDVALSRDLGVSDMNKDEED
jgi:DnaK suppressor protein